MDDCQIIRLITSYLFARNIRNTDFSDIFNHRFHGQFTKTTVMEYYFDVNLPDRAAANEVSGYIVNLGSYLG